MRSSAHGRAQAEVCVAVAGRFEGDWGSSGLGCVGCCSKPQTAQTFQAPPASLWPLSFQPLLFFSPFFLPPISRPLLFSLLPLHQRRSLAGRWRRREKKWVSGSAPATGSGWWLSLWNWSPAAPAERPSTLQP